MTSLAEVKTFFFGITREVPDLASLAKTAVWSLDRENVEDITNSYGDARF